MTAQEISLASIQWQQVYEILHGPLTVEERQMVYDIVEFLCACAATAPAPGTPYHSELIADAQND